MKKPKFKKLFNKVSDVKDDHILILRNGKLYQVIDKECTDEMLAVVNCGTASDKEDGFYIDCVHLVSSLPADKLLSEDVSIRTLR